MADSYPAMRKALAKVLLDWSDAVAIVLRQAQAEGEISKDKDADLMARFLVNAWQGATTRSRIDKNRAALDDFLTVAFDILLI